MHDLTRSLISYLIAGTWRFTVVALLGFAPWALGGRWFNRTLGEIGLYGVCLGAFLLGALCLLPPLLPGNQRLRRTALGIIPAYTLYAVVWCSCWFALGGKLGEWIGAILGGTIFVVICAWRFGRPSQLLFTCLLFVVTHALGYFAGEFAMAWCQTQAWPKSFGMWAWGLCYGVGFGAGLGYVVAVCQRTKTPVY
jgi:hypothetical protein